ncbi:MAG: hypothetical protein L3K19_04120 [Thermoplasmata archaeon]|nr:hypothetical protein [Thermoplasmata archaeon]
MKRSHLAVALVLTFVLAGLLSAPIHSSRSNPSAGGFTTHLTRAALAPDAKAVVHAAPAPSVGYPRTVLVETFTGVWCHYCPAESQALYTIDQQSNENVLAIAELHVCAGSPCLENYVPPDQTSNSRVAFYSVQGFPTVFFDGQNAIVGGNSSWTWAAAQTIQKTYQKSIDNAASFPGNVSITQHASMSSPGNVTDFTNITSPIDATYNVVSYLLEYVNKLNVSNGYGPHDIGQVVRATLRNHPVTFTAGTPQEIQASGKLDPAWNTKNLSVVTFAQLNSTMVVENANMAPVTTLTTAVATNVTTVLSNASSTITVTVANSSTGAPVSGASIWLTSSAGGTLNPASGVTASDGTFSSKFTAPTVTSSESIVISARVVAAGYSGGTATTSVLVNPVVLPAVPTGLTIAPASQEVTLNWTTPVTGAGGLTYFVYRANSQTGIYSPVGYATSTGFNDTTPVSGQSYWYKVSARNSFGYSANTSSVSATSVIATAQGLPANVGWWLAIGSVNASTLINAPIAIYLPVGVFPYSFGPGSYAYMASPNGPPVTAAGSSISISATFTPRYASLQGTVSPASAVVTLNGAAIALDHGSFTELLIPGTYTLNVSASGFQPNTTVWTLTPGNLTPVTVSLVQLQSGGGGSLTASNGGLTGDELLALVAAIAVIGAAAIIGVAIIRSEKGKRDQSARAGTRGPRSPRPPGNSP